MVSRCAVPEMHVVVDLLSAFCCSFPVSFSLCLLSHFAGLIGGVVSENRVQIPWGFCLADGYMVYVLQDVL